MGLVGAVPVSVWASSLLRNTSRVLLDAEMEAPVVDEMRGYCRLADQGATE